MTKQEAQSRIDFLFEDMVGSLDLRPTALDDWKVDTHQIISKLELSINTPIGKIPVNELEPEFQELKTEITELQRIGQEFNTRKKKVQDVSIRLWNISPRFKENDVIAVDVGHVTKGLEFLVVKAITFLDGLRTMVTPTSEFDEQSSYFLEVDAMFKAKRVGFLDDTGNFHMEL